MHHKLIVHVLTVVGLLLLLGIGIAKAESQKPDIVVSADGSGDFKTVQEAIDAVTTNDSTPAVIFIKPGTYKEKLNRSKSTELIPPCSWTTRNKRTT